jgi:TRAP-type uncharacterized transport system substrate-binding protein
LPVAACALLRVQTFAAAPAPKPVNVFTTSNLGYHYFGEGRFFILLGKRFAETMLELLKNG